MKVLCRQRHFAVLTAVLACSSCLIWPSAVAAETLRFQTYVNEVDIRYKGFQIFADEVKKNSNGRLQLQIFTNNTLHPYGKAIDSLLSGISDISPVSGGAVDQRLPCARVTQLVPASFNWEKVVELDREFLNFVREEYLKAGLVPIISSNYSYDQDWFFRKPVAKLDQLNGMQVRTWAPVLTHIIKTWRGAPVTVDTNEVYQAAERGVVDGINMGVATFASQNLWNVMPHMVSAHMFYGNAIYAMSKSRFDKLAPQDQKAILDAGKTAEEFIKGPYEAWIHERIGAAVMKAGSAGVTVTTLPRAERTRLVETVYKGWAPEVEKACGPEKAKRLRALFEKYG